MLDRTVYLIDVIRFDRDLSANSTLLGLEVERAILERRIILD